MKIAQKISNQKCSVYRCTFVRQPPQYQSSAAQTAQHTECTRKAKEKGGKRQRKEAKMLDQIAKKKKKKKKKKNLHVHTFSHRDPYAMNFREYKNLAVLDCEE